MYPKGLHDILMIMKNKYGNPPIYITENGKLSGAIYIYIYTLKFFIYSQNMCVS